MQLWKSLLPTGTEKTAAPANHAGFSLHRGPSQPEPLEESEVPAIGAGVHSGVQPSIGVGPTVRLERGALRGLEGIVI
jgi:hypothetical protein